MESTALRKSSNVHVNVAVLPAPISSVTSARASIVFRLLSKTRLLQIKHSGYKKKYYNRSYMIFSKTFLMAGSTEVNL